jgi:site-specific DNA-methyltransferase (adenine-specific)
VGVACKQLNRKFIGIEKVENYYNIAKKRINEMDVNLEVFRNG